MTTPTPTPATPLPAGATFGEPQDTPVTLPPSLPVGATFGEPSEAASTLTADGNPKFTPYSAASFGRYTTPENYENWASTHPKAGVDSKPGEYEAWTGAHMSKADAMMTVPKAAGETLEGTVGVQGLTSLPATLPAILPHTIEGVKALGAWANAHPFQAWALYNTIKEFLPGAKKAMGFVKSVPE